MKRSLTLWQTAGFIFTGIMGVVLHFLFDWTEGNIAVPFFSAVNESIWEHTKLLFFPMLIFAFVQKRYIGNNYTDFCCTKLFGMLKAIGGTIVLYYTINGVFGKTPDWINIAMFFVVDFAVYYTETVNLRKKKICSLSTKTVTLILIFVVLIYVWFTFYPPQIPLFRDPVTGTYGYYRQYQTILLDNLIKIM